MKKIRFKHGLITVFFSNLFIFLIINFFDGIDVFQTRGRISQKGLFHFVFNMSIFSYSKEKFESAMFLTLGSTFLIIIFFIIMETRHDRNNKEIIIENPSKYVISALTLLGMGLAFIYMLYFYNIENTYEKMNSIGGRGNMVIKLMLISPFSHFFIITFFQAAIYCCLVVPVILFLDIFKHYTP